MLKLNFEKSILEYTLTTLHFKNTSKVSQKLAIIYFNCVVIDANRVQTRN